MKLLSSLINMKTEVITEPRISDFLKYFSTYFESSFEVVYRVPILRLFEVVFKLLKLFSIYYIYKSYIMDVTKFQIFKVTTWK